MIPRHATYWENLYGSYKIACFAAGQDGRERKAGIGEGSHRRSNGGNGNIHNNVSADQYRNKNLGLDIPSTSKEVSEISEEDSNLYDFFSSPTFGICFYDLYDFFISMV